MTRELTTLAIAPRRRRQRHPMGALMAHAVATGMPTGNSRPSLVMAEPEDGHARRVSTLLSLGLHAAVLLAIVITAALAPPALIEKVIPVEILREPAPLPGSNLEPAPAGPKAVGAARPSAAAMAAAPGLTPEQAAALRQAALEAARRAVEEVPLEQDAAPSLPTQIERRDVQSSSVAARAAAAVSPAAPVAVEPVRIDPADLAALDLDLAGPTEIDTASLADLSAPEALAALQALEHREYTGAVQGTTVAHGASLAGTATGGGALDTGVPSGYGGGDGTGGNGLHGAGSGGTGTATGVVRCLESRAVQRYQEMMQARTDARWHVPEDVPADAQVQLRLMLDAAGMAHDVEVVAADSGALGESAMQALLSASPFPPMDDHTRCLADKRFKMTFTVPQP